MNVGRGRGAGLLLAGIVLFHSVWAPADAQEPIEEIVAVVGDKAIMLSEIEEQFDILSGQLALAPGDTASANQLRRDILQRMVDDQLLYLEAKTQGIEAPKEDIDAAVQQAVADNIRALGGEESFQRELRSEGMTLEMLESRFREEAERQAVAARLIQREIRPKVKVTDADVQSFFEKHKAELPKRPRAVQLQDLYFQVRPDSVVLSRTAERARSIRQEVLNGLPFAEAAMKHSDDPTSADKGGLLGKVERGQLNPELEAIAFALPAGVVSEPIATPFGFNLIHVDSKDPAGQWVEVRLILVGAQPSRSDEAAAADRARAVHARLTRGEIEFTEAVRRYSEDPTTRQQDGNLGWLSAQGFMGEVKAAIDAMKAGEISAPVPGDNGYHIFRILEEETERDYTFDEIQEELRQYAFQEALEGHLREWLDEVKKKYYIEQRVRL